MKRSLMCRFGHLKYKFFLKANEGFLAKHRVKKIKKKKFTIISNNCWGGYIYRLFNTQYLSPTIGLFIMPEDYIKFVDRLEYYIGHQLCFIKPEDSKHAGFLRTQEKFGQYPIGKIDDIEIMFVHYKSQQEALDKWTRRARRINWENIIVKFNDQNGCTKKQIESFNNIKRYKKMICFTAKKVPGKYNIHMWEFKKDGYVVDDKYYVFQHINLRKLIDS